MQSTVVDISVKCPQCGAHFRTRQLGLLYDSGHRNSELRHKPDIPGFFETERFTVCTCPGCGKADWAEAFEPTDETAHLSQQKLTPHLQFRTAAIEAERQGSNWYNVGLLYVHAAWCADDVRALPQAREYRRLAADAFEKALRDRSCPEEEVMEVQYLAGELLRRAGDFQKSLAYFKEVVPRLSSKYAYMARRLMRMCEAGDASDIRFEKVGP